MGTVRVTKQASAEFSEAELQRWFGGKCDEMAEDGGTGTYCGNWNSCSGLAIVRKTFSTRAEANVYLEKHIEKGESVLAVRVGDFSATFPATKEQKAMSEKLAALLTEVNELEYRILERSKKQKSKTKKCSNCESSINVHHLALPELSELSKVSNSFTGEYAFRRMGRVLFVNPIGLTDCPVCQKNLLKTDTDVKNEAALKSRYLALNAKVREKHQAHAKTQAGKPQPYWLVSADCAE